MVRSGYFWRLFASMAAALLVVALIVVFTLPPAVISQSEASARAQLRTTAAVAARVLQDSPDTPDRTCTGLATATGLRFTVFDATGRLVADSDGFAAGAEGATLYPEIRDALSGGLGEARRDSVTTGTDTLFTAHAVAAKSGAEPTMVVRVAMPWSSVEARSAPARVWVWLATAVGLLLSLGLSLWLARRLVAPVEDLTRLALKPVSAEAATSGETGRHEAATDEVGLLTRAVVAMRSRLLRRASAAEHRHEEVLRVLGSLRDGVIAVGREVEITHINRSAEQLFRLPRGSAVGRLLHEVVRVPGVLEAADSATAGRSVPACDVHLHHGAVERVVELQASPLRDATGRPSGCAIVLRDVTELRGLETMRQDFVANVSHELKTPLTAIRSLTETLLDDDLATPETRRRFLEKIEAQSARLLALVTDLLSLSRLESPPADPVRTVVDLGECAGEVARLLTPSAAAKDIAVSLEIPQSAVSVLGEEESLRQMLSNLLDNALKYTPKGGRVWLAVGTDGDSALLEVRDTGIGIEASQIDRIFERFYRVDKARSREVGGTGLGLAIVKHVVASHGGDISVKSVPGHGSTFTVRLPLAKG